MFRIRVLQRSCGKSNNNTIVSSFSQQQKQQIRKLSSNNNNTPKKHSPLPARLNDPSSSSDGSGGFGRALFKITLGSCAGLVGGLLYIRYKVENDADFAAEAYKILKSKDTTVFPHNIMLSLFNIAIDTNVLK